MCVCVLCFCLLVPELLYLAFEHVHGAIDLGRALESWAPLGGPLADELGMMFMHLETGICLDIQKRASVAL